MKKEKRNTVIVLATVIMMAAVFIALVIWQKKSGADKKAESVEHGIKAMFITFGADNNIFIDLENKEPFEANFPKEIYGIDGELLTKEQLKKGNVVEVYGNGVIALSYPGQYHGVTKIQVIEEGTPSDADKYQDIIDGIYGEPDPAETPFLNVEYTVPKARVTTMITRGAYQWTYEDKEGKLQEAVTDMAHVLTWKDMNTITLEADTDFKLVFSRQPDRVTVHRWKSEECREMSDTGEIPVGEEVTVKKNGGDSFHINGEAGYVYLVRAEWDSSYVEYGFLTN